jgi:hypothetical protein
MSFRCMNMRAIAVAAAILAFGPLVSGARAASGDPLAHLTLSPAGAEGFEGPCGLAVDSTANLFVSDYYRDAVDMFTPGESTRYAYAGQLAGVDPIDGPCGLAVGSNNRLYVNDFHRAVFSYGVSYGTAVSFGPRAILAGAGLDESRPTGVAFDSDTGRTYVDCRTYIAAFGTSGAPIEEGGSPLHIGAGTLVDGYGLATDSAGRLYVADAAAQAVEVYDPAVSTTNPVASLQPPGGFVSLRDSTLAVDLAGGRLYVADDTQPTLTESPEAQVDVFSTAGSYLGVLKYRVYDALPMGLAVDNSALSSTGRVFLTSGNAGGASLFVYPAGAQVGASQPVQSAPRATAATAAQTAGVAGSATPTGGPGQDGEALARAAAAPQVVQRGQIRLSISGHLEPERLPRKGSAPVSVSVGWKLSGVEGAPPPALKGVQIEINRQGHFDFTGLPVCPVAKIQPASTQRALSNCRTALVGKGSFTAEAGLSGQESYEAHGTLLLFNGERHGKPVLLGQIYAAHPFASSSVITFNLSSAKQGTYGTVLSATLPESLTNWGNLTGVQMHLSRRYRYEGISHSYISAGCPAPKGFPGATFSLARAGFSFAGEPGLTSVLSSNCQARG